MKAKFTTIFSSSQLPVTILVFVLAFCFEAFSVCGVEVGSGNLIDGILGLPKSIDLVALGVIETPFGEEGNARSATHYYYSNVWIIYEIDLSGNVTRTVEFPDLSFWGLAYVDGAYGPDEDRLYGMSGSTLVEFDPKDMSHTGVIHNIPDAYGTCAGGNGRLFAQMARPPFEIAEIDLDDGSIIQSLLIPNIGLFAGLAYDGVALYGSEIISNPIPQLPDTNLWIIDPDAGGGGNTIFLASRWYSALGSENITIWPSAADPMGRLTTTWASIKKQ